MTQTHVPVAPNSSALAVVMQSARPAFLLLPPVCLLLGWSYAWSQGYSAPAWLYLVCVLVAVSAHISVNQLNEYHDFKSGLDLTTHKTPFSGGSGALPDNPRCTPFVLCSGVLNLALCMAGGVGLAFYLGSDVLLVGGLGILIILSYTPWLNRSAILCLLAPGLGFGVLMSLGAYFVVARQFDAHMFLLSLIPFALCNGLLLLNQFPDAKADAHAGRKHAVIAWGYRPAALIFMGLQITWSLLVAALVNEAVLPLQALWVLPLLALTLGSAAGAWRHGAQLGQYPHWLAANVATTLLVPVGLSLSLLLT